MFEVSSCLFFVCSRRVPWWGYDLYLPQAWPRVNGKMAEYGRSVICRKSSYT